MDWTALSVIAGMLAAVFVGLIEVRLALQTRACTQATHSQTWHLATSALAEMAAIIGQDRELSRIFRIGMIAPEVLTGDDFTPLGYLGISLFRRFENVFFQPQSGMIGDDFWIGHRKNILWSFHRPGMQAQWKDRSFACSRRFREFLDPSSPQQVDSPPTRRL